MEEERQHISHRAVNVGLVANIFLSLVKTAVGIVSSSHALLADGINSTSDVVYYVAVKIFIRVAHEPPDREHPYGHRQAETIAALVVGSFVITTAAAIFWNAMETAFNILAGHQEWAGISIMALFVALFSIGLKVFLTVWTSRAGDRTGNAAVAALASDHRNDILASTAAAIGIFLGRIGLPWFDPLAGALVALLVLKTGIEILRDSAADLMDTVPGQALEQQIRRELSGIEEIRELHEIHAHRFGPSFVINLTIALDGDMTMKRADRISERIRAILYNRMDYVLKVYVHYHAFSEADVKG